MLENSESTLTPTGVLMATGKVEDIFEKNFMTAAKFSVEIENICLLYTSDAADES